MVHLCTIALLSDRGGEAAHVSQNEKGGKLPVPNPKSREMGASIKRNGHLIVRETMPGHDAVF